MKKYVLRHKGRLIQGVLFGWIQMFCIFFANLKISGLITVCQKGETKDIIREVAILLLFLLGTYLSVVVGARGVQTFASRIAGDIRYDYFKVLYKEKSSAFFKREKSDYITDLETNMNQLRLDYFSQIPYMISSIGQSLICVVGLIYFHYYIFLAAMLAMIFPVIASKLFSEKISKLNLETAKRSDVHMNKMAELLDGYFVIKQSKGRERFLADYDKKDRFLLDNKIEHNTKVEAFNGAILCLNIVSIMIVVLIGSILVARGEMDIGILVASMIMVSVTANMIAEAFRHIGSFYSSRKLAHKILDLAERVEKEENIGGKTPKLELQIEDLGYRYADKRVFRNLSFRIEEGKSYAVIGKSGSGKSTLAKTLIKLNDNYEGRIRFSNGDFKDFSEEEIYKTFYYIPQQPVIFKDSLKNNILMNTEEVSEEAFKKIIKEVRLEEVYKAKGDSIMDPDSLSGGEKKKVELARALVTKKEVIIFDEPTAGLDPENARQIEDLLFCLQNIVVITHNQEKAYLEKFDEVVMIG